MVAFSLLQSTEPVLVPTVFKETLSRARVDIFFILQINRPKGFTKLFVFAKNMWLRSCWLCWYRVSVVVDYVDTCPNSCWLRRLIFSVVVNYCISKCDFGIVNNFEDTAETMYTVHRPFWKTLKASHRFIRNNQTKKVTGCVYIPNSNNLKIWKCGLT